MTVLVDFLPASFRERQRRARQRRERCVFAVVVLAAIVATDLVLRMRVAGLERLVVVAKREADAAAERLLGTDVLTAEAAELRAKLASWVRPVGVAGMAVLLDQLLADRPDDVLFQELRCGLNTWDASVVPTLRIDVTCADVSSFSKYLDALDQRGSLPALAFEPTSARRPDGSQSFALRNASGADR